MMCNMMHMLHMLWGCGDVEGLAWLFGRSDEHVVELHMLWGVEDKVDGGGDIFGLQGFETRVDLCGESFALCDPLRELCFDGAWADRGDANVCVMFL